MISQSDLKIGMYLNNNGPGVVPIYEQKTSVFPELVIKKGELIGQIIDFTTGPDGMMVVFRSDAIDKVSSKWEKAEHYLSFGYYTVSGLVKFSELQKNINESQVSAQNAAISLAEANGNSLKNSFVKLAHGLAETIEESIPWKLVWVASGTYVLLNWNKFFSPTKLRK
jgi:hypothetical protein